MARKATIIIPISTVMKLLQNIILSSLRLAVKIQLMKNRPLIIGVTGSAGKTSTVGAIARVVETKYSTKQTTKGNSETGIPFEILNIPVKTYQGLGWLWTLILAKWQLLTYWPTYKVLVVEMGIDSDKPPKNMGYLLSIIQPIIGVFLNVNAVHGQNFSGDDTVQAIANEKGKLLTSLQQNGLAVYSADHPQITVISDSVKALRKTFSVTKKTADAVLQKHTVSLKGTTFEFTIDGASHRLHFSNYCMFKETFGSFASALLVGNHLGVPVEQGITALEKF